MPSGQPLRFGGWPPPRRSRGLFVSVRAAASLLTLYDSLPMTTLLDDRPQVGCFAAECLITSSQKTPQGTPKFPPPVSPLPPWLTKKRKGEVLITGGGTISITLLKSKFTSHSPLPISRFWHGLTTGLEPQFLQSGRKTCTCPVGQAQGLSSLCRSALLKSHAPRTVQWQLTTTCEVHAPYNTTSYILHAVYSPRSQHTTE